MAAAEICHADILNRIFRFEKKSFAVKWNYENHFTFTKKNSEYTAVAGSVSRQY